MSAPKPSTMKSRASEAFNAHYPRSKQVTKQSTAPFSMRLTEDEQAFLDALCGGRSWTAYIRECVFGETATPRRAIRRPKLEDEALAAALSGLGQSRLSSNLNQLARSANIGVIDVSDDIEGQLEDACTAILEMRKALMTALGLRAGGS